MKTVSLDKIVPLSKLEHFFKQLATVFATKTDVNNKVDKVEGKGLSTNDFTDKYKDVYSYYQPVPEEGMLALTLRGPDNAIYRLRLNDQMDLELEPFVNSKKVQYMISGNTYYSLNETAEGHIQLVESTILPEGATAGRIRVIDNSDYTKYELVVENGNVSFKEVTESIVDEARYLVSNNNGGEKVYCFKIEKGVVYAECITIHSNELSVVQLNNN